MQVAKIVIVQPIKKMPIHYRSMLTLEYKDLIAEKFNFLAGFFDFEPGDIFIEVLPLEDFDKFYELEMGKKPESFIVGSALNNGRVIVLNKKDFPKKANHYEEEFENVILHELAHMFIRRILWPKQTYIWIQEGICEYLSFGKIKFRVKKFINFSEIETWDGWDRHNSYQQAALFFKFLVKKFGERKISEFIKKIKEKSEEESFKEVFGKELNKLEQEFKTLLENEKITSSRNTL